MMIVVPQNFTAPYFQKTHPRTEWYAFIDEAAEVNLTILNDILVNHESMGEFFIGHAIEETKRYVNYAMKAQTNLSVCESVSL
jgi:hypothetical protein